MNDGELKHTINLIVGDWSHDGHNMTETITIRSNLDKKALEIAFKKGCELVDVDFKEVASDFEDNELPNDVIEKLTKHGYNVDDHADELWQDDPRTLPPEGFVTTWLFIAKIGDPNLGYEVMDDHNDRIYVGGYGLFFP